MYRSLSLLLVFQQHWISVLAAMRVHFRTKRRQHQNSRDDSRAALKQQRVRSRLNTVHYILKCMQFCFFFYYFPSPEQSDYNRTLTLARALGWVVQSWVKITQGQCRIWIQIWKLKKHKSVLILFVYKLMIGSFKNNRENYPRKCFWTQEKETRVKFNPGLSANRPLNNWAQVYNYFLYCYACCTGSTTKLLKKLRQISGHMNL